MVVYLVGKGKLTLEELIPRTREAIELCLEVEGLDETPMRFVGVQEIELAA